MPLGLHDGKTGPKVPDWYHEEWFAEEFRRRFDLVERIQLEPNRVLYVGKLRAPQAGKGQAITDPRMTDPVLPEPKIASPTAALEPVCPSCGQDRCENLGSLPNRHWFAGRRCPAPLTGGGLYRCNTCALKFRFPIFSRSQYLRLYDNGATDTWSEQHAREDWARIIRFVATEIAPGSNILDFGCNTGGLLARLGPAHHKFGVELNAAAAQVARASAAATIWAALEEISSSIKFDLILVVDVIEHVQNPSALIASLVPLLTEKGVLLITSGDAEYSPWEKFGANWWYCAYPEHIAFISGSWLAHWAPRLSVEVVRCEHFSYGGMTRFKRVVETLFTDLYGRMPSLYLSTMATFLRLTGAHREVPIPGAGLGPDHLFVVLAKG